MQSCVVSHLSGNSKTWMLPHSIQTVWQLCQFLHSVEGCSEEHMRVQCLGRLLNAHDAIPQDSTLSATLTLLGGKGGFGSMLRAIGAQIEKTTNKEACRDLSGRRLRDINQEKSLKEQIQKRAEKERERLENRKKKFASLLQEPKHIFNDSSYYKEQEEITKSLYNSVDKGLKVAAMESTASCSKSSSSASGENSCWPADQDNSKKGVKRKVTDTAETKAKKRRFFDDLDESSDDSDQEK